MNIAELTVHYVSEQVFQMAVRLRSPYDEYEEYQSRDINDAAILRHLGVMKMNGNPVFDGFYPLNLGKERVVRSATLETGVPMGFWIH